MKEPEGDLIAMRPELVPQGDPFATGNRRSERGRDPTITTAPPHKRRDAQKTEKQVTLTKEPPPYGRESHESQLEQTTAELKKKKKKNRRKCKPTAETEHTQPLKDTNERA